MADDLKRVGLTFKTDGTVDFKKSLQEINSSVMENRTAFKLAQSQWNDNTKSIDKLRDRQKYLASQTRDYTDKVALLEEELSNLENEEEKNIKAISSKRAQLNTAKTSLNNYKRVLEEVEGELSKGTFAIEEYVKKIEDIENKSKEVGKTMSTHITAPIAAVGGLAIKSAIELDEGYDTIITKTGATGETLQELNDIADEVFGSMPIEMSDAGIAVGEVNTRFGVTGEVLRELSEDFLRFANINGVDLNNSIGTVDKIMTQFNIDASETNNVLGLLTARSQETGIATDVLMNSVSTNSSTFKELGLSLTDSVNLLAQFEANGVNSSTAITGLQKAVINMSKDGLTANEAIVQIVESIKNASTATEAMNIASEVFGTKGAVQMTDAIRSGRFSLDELSDSLTNYGNTVQNTYETTLDPWDKMKIATNDLKLAGTELASSIFEVLTPMIDLLCEKIDETTEWFNGLDEGQKETIVTIGLVVAAIGPLLMIFGTLAGSVTKIIGLVTSTISLFGKMNGAMSTAGVGANALWIIMKKHPIGSIITIISALVTAFVTAYNKCEWFREGVDRVFGNIVNFIGGAVDKIKGFLNFDWSLPKIKLPHFSIKGKFSLNPPSIPTFGVSWYAKGGILNKPTIFGQSGGRLLGGGEAGKEAVLPISLLKDYIREENRANNSVLVSAIREALSELNLVAENNIYIGDRKVADVLTDMVVKKVTARTNQYNMVKGR